MYLGLEPDDNILPHHPRHSSHSNSNTTDQGSFRIGGSGSGSFYNTSDTQVCHGLVSIDAVVETESYFFLVQPYYVYTLRDSVTFSPAILEGSHAKPLFIVYQLLQAMHALHNHGLRMGDIRVCDVVMDKNMWLRVTSPRLSILKPTGENMSSNCSESGSLYLTANSPDVEQKKNFFPLLKDLTSSATPQVNCLEMF